MKSPVLMLVAMALLSGCAGPRPAPTVESLRARGLQELAAPSASPVAVAPPPGLDPDRITAAAPQRSREPLEVVLRQLAEAAEPAPPAQPIAEADRIEAIKRYAAGRSLLRSGDPAGAISELIAATALDPQAGAAWLVRAEAELTAMRRIDGISSLARAAQLGAGGAIEREILGRSAMDRRDFESAARWFAEARRMAPEQVDPALAVAIDIQLGLALEQLGHDAAARELLAGALPALGAVEPVGPFGSLVASALRQQRLYWTLMGDLCCRLEDYPQAALAYERAAATPGPADPSLIEARCYAALRAPAPSYAAAIALERAGDGPRIDDAAAALLLAVAAASEPAGAALRAALQARLLSDPAASASLAIVLAAMTPERATEILLQAHRDAPDDPGLIEALARSVALDPPQGAVGLGARMIRAAPLRSAAIAHALARTYPDTAGLIAAAAASNDAAAQILGARLLGLTGQPGAGVELLPGPGQADLALGAQLARAELAARDGDWQVFERTVEEMAAAGAEARQAYASALAAGQRFEAALAVLGPLMETAAPAPNVSLPAAWLALGLGDAERAADWLDAAVAASPHDEQLHGLRIRAVGELPGEQARARFARALSELRTQLPGSPTAQLLEARALIAQGRAREAQAVLLALAEDPLRAAEALEMAELLWSASSTPEQLLEAARSWLELRAPQRPQAPSYAIALGAVLLELDDQEGALAALRAGQERFAWPQLELALERTLRTAGREAEANQRALARLTQGPAGIDPSLQLADLHAGAGRLADARIPLGRIPEASQLTAEQTELLARIAERGAEAVQRSADEQTLADAAALFELAVRPGVGMAPAFHEQRLAVLIAWKGSTPEQLARAVAQATTPPGADAEGLLAARAAAELAGAGRYRDCLEMFDLLAQSAAALGPTAMDVWLEVVERQGTPADARRLLEAAASQGGLCALAERRGLDISVRLSEAECAAGLAGAVLGGWWDLQGRTDDAIEAFRLARRYLPDDPGTANDLGYTLLEARRDLQEAVRLIELAYREEPDNPNVLDSIGWLRYRQGIFEDEIGPGGEIIREGAVTLLGRSVATPVGMTSATIMDHLGDALWQVGRRDGALMAWRSALSLAQTAPPGMEAELREKIRAASRGGSPAVAPVYDDWPEGESEGAGS
ncbi:MAG: hypothetical protein ACF8R7_06835 [Phycisphaerales bacterium JB039]